MARWGQPGKDLRLPRGGLAAARRAQRRAGRGERRERRRQRNWPWGQGPLKDTHHTTREGHHLGTDDREVPSGHSCMD